MPQYFVLCFLFGYNISLYQLHYVDSYSTLWPRAQPVWLAVASTHWPSLILTQQSSGLFERPSSPPRPLHKLHASVPAPANSPAPVCLTAGTPYFHLYFPLPSFFPAEGFQRNGSASYYTPCAATCSFDATATPVLQAEPLLTRPLCYITMALLSAVGPWP